MLQLILVVIFAFSLTKVFALQLCSNSTIGLQQRDDTVCTKFHQCTIFGDIAFDCPFGMVFNENLQACDCGGYKRCNGQLVPTVCPKMIGPNLCKNSAVGDLLLHPYACDVFFQCSSIGPMVFVCPHGTFFNPDSNVCDWPKNTYCENRDYNYRQPGARQYPPCYSNACYAPFWVVCNCPSYPGCPCMCSSVAEPAKPLVKPQGTTLAPLTTTSPFVDSTQTPEVAEKNDELKIDYSRNQTNLLTMHRCPFPDNPLQPTHLPHKQCNLFYKCLMGVQIEFKCPSELVWNIGRDRCDYESDFHCLV